MADLLHTADMEAERLKREGAEEAERAKSEAERIAYQLRREADVQAEQMRREGEEMLWRATAETDRILGGLAVKREEMLKELEATRGRLRGVMSNLESTITVTRDEAKRGSEAAGQVAERAHAEVGQLEPPPRLSEPAPPATPPWESEPPDSDRAAVAQEEISDIAFGAAPPAWEAATRGVAAERPDMLESVEGFDLVLPDIRI